MTPTHTSAPWPASPLVAAVLALGCCGLVLAACGTSSPSDGTATGSAPPNPARAQDFLKFSKCMRAHGIANFPDPSSGGGIELSAGSGLDPQSPSFQAAQKACLKLLPGGGPHGSIPASARRELLAMAQCMRTHGVPDYPDPQFPAGGGILQKAPSSADASSPAFQAAAKACNAPVQTRGPDRVRAGGSRTSG